MPVITTSIDGVEVFWTASGRQRLAASLIFRVGAADETLTTAGSTHLLEHLFLHGEPPASVEVNGSTSPLLVSLDVLGPPDAVAEHLNRLCRRVSRFPLEEVAHERRVLAAEGAARPVSVLGRVLAARYGATGPGLTAWGDYAVGSLEGPQLQAWLAARFTAGNAALALDGPVPTNLRLPLPPGPRLPTPRPTPRPLPFPVIVDGFDDAVTLSGLVTRGPAVAPALAIWRRRARRSLVGTIGPRAQVLGLSEFAGPDPVVGLLVRVERRGAAGCLRVLRAELAELVATGATERELADELQVARLVAATPDTARAEPWAAARLNLIGVMDEDADARLAAQAAVTPADVAAVLAEVQRTLIVQAPAGTELGAEPDLRRTPVDDPAPEPGAITFRSAGPRGLLVRAAPVIRLGASTITYRTATEDFTLGLSDLAAASFRPDGACRLVSRSGDTLRLEPTLWNRGPRLASLLRQRIPPHLILQLDPVPADQLPKPDGWRELYASAVRRLAGKGRARR